MIGTPFNVCSKEEHIHNIEQWYWTVKERCYCYYAIITFKYLLWRIVVELIIIVSFYVNIFIWKYGISEVLLPLIIVEGVVLDFYLHFRMIYGEFCQTYEGTNNTIALYTTDTVALGPNGNLQGGV